MECDTVWNVYPYRRTIHNHGAVFRVDMEKGHVVGLMVKGHQKLIIGKQTGILGILAPHRQTENL